MFNSMLFDSDIATLLINFNATGGSIATIIYCISCKQGASPLLINTGVHWWGAVYQSQVGVIQHLPLC